MNVTGVLLLLALAATEPTEDQLVDRIVAVVNDEIITLSDIKAREAPFEDHNETPDKKKRLRQDVLDSLISERLLQAQVSEAKIEVSESEVERAIEDILRQNKITREQLQQVVEARGMSMSQYREDLEKQLVRLKLIDLKVRSKVVVPESDLRSEYDRQMALEGPEELVSISHLFFRWGESPDPEERARVMAKAKAALARAKAGENFADLAKKVSEGPTASSGGSLGEMNKRNLLPELARAVEKLETGKVSEPIETDNGVHIVLIDSRRKKPKQSFEDLKAEIHQKLYQREVERQMKLWVDELRSRAAIDVRL